MRKKLTYGLVLFIMMAIIPVCSTTAAERADKPLLPSVAAKPVATPYTEDMQQNAPAKSAEEYKDFLIYDTASEKIITVSNKEFLIGGTAAEVPQSFEPEAIKAQAVAAYTYYSRQRSVSREKGDKYDFSADLSKGEKYVTDELLRERCGDNYNKVRKIYEKAADETEGLTLTYNGQIALTVFYAISSGVTEASENVFASPVEYLVPVASPYDCNAPGYKTEAVFSSDEAGKLIKKLLDTDTLPENPYEWISEAQKSKSGTVLSIIICGKECTGLDVRSAFDLRSADFDVVYNGEEFTFTVRGYGHNVGMSQHGANFMAQQGADCEEILNHYYPGTVLG